ncbi:N-acetylmuramoyl-L-alanine amidase family protein [Anaerostipes sp.]|uniref:N-acetylmuramoyl-L-alanine amidase family protein n=1 Tax=Anaerostipes sp. TaxID=1872530 RepID=UPI0025BB299B|nr:N-acetylmuramoyl-L-alanine amidase [Anaerostipes sp.]MBS7009216.1 N-acetylmuramoyl-L-alanine amidase [Anaerostipes sp.]
MKKLKTFILAVCILLCVFYTGKINLSRDTGKRTALKETVMTPPDKDKDERMIIEIDPGHGGEDTGAQITADQTVTYEKTLNLKLSLYLKRALEKYQGVAVYMTRETDKNISLKKRVKKAKKDQADVLISIHHNAKGSIVDTEDGAYVLTASGNDKKNLAQKEEQLGANILNRIRELGLKNRGLLRRFSEAGETYSNGRLSDYYAVVKGGINESILAVIIEHGYMDNIDEFKLYFSSDEKIQKIAEKDALGIADYFHLIKDTQRAERIIIKKNMQITTVKDPNAKNNTYQTKSYKLSVNR